MGHLHFLTIIVFLVNVNCWSEREVKFLSWTSSIFGVIVVCNNSTPRCVTSFILGNEFMGKLWVNCFPQAWLCKKNQQVKYVCSAATAKCVNRCTLSPSLCELQLPYDIEELGTIIASGISSPGDFRLTRLVLDPTDHSWPGGIPVLPALSTHSSTSLMDGFL